MKITMPIYMATFPQDFSKLIFPIPPPGSPGYAMPLSYIAKLAMTLEYKHSQLKYCLILNTHCENLRLEHIIIAKITKPSG